MHCRTVNAALCGLAALGLAAPSIVHAEPRGVINWLNEAAETPDVVEPVAPFEGVSPDGETAPNGDSLDPLDAAAPLTPQEIETEPVAGVVADSAGLITEGEGGFPVDFWKGVTAERARALLQQVGPSGLRSVNELARSALITAASAPSAAGEDGEIITARAQALLELGSPQDALALLRASGLRTPEAMALQLDAAALIGEDGEACALALRSEALADLSARRVYCLTRTGATQEASLALATGRDQGLIREADGLLLEALIEPSWAEFARAPDRVQDLTPLRLAALDQIGVARPSDFGLLAPLAMRWADMREDAAPRDQLTAAEQLEEAGALPTEKLRELYSAYTPAESGGVWGRVEAWRNVRDARGAFERIDAAVDAYDRAALDGRNRSMARLLAPLLDSARPSGDNRTPEVRQSLAIAGNFDDAAYWFSAPPTIGQRAAAMIAAPQSASNLGKAQLAALRAKDSLGDLAAGQQLAALTAFGFIERESRFTSTSEMRVIVEALETGQTAEVLFAALNYLAPGEETRPEPFSAALTALIALQREEEARRIALEAFAPAL